MNVGSNHRQVGIMSEIDDGTAIAQAQAKVIDAALSWWFARRDKPAPKPGVEADLWAAVAVLRRHLGARHPGPDRSG